VGGGGVSARLGGRSPKTKKKKFHKTGQKSRQGLHETKTKKGKGENPSKRGWDGERKKYAKKKKEQRTRCVVQTQAKPHHQ